MTILVVTLLGIGFLLSRVRLQRVMLNLRGEKWLAELPAAPASNVVKCFLRIHPFFYPPSRFLISENGVVVLGWHYVVLLPYSQIKSIQARTKGDLSGTGFYLTRSFSNLVEIQMRLVHDAVVIGPDKPEYFLEKSRNLNSTHHVH